MNTLCIVILVIGCIIAIPLILALFKGNEFKVEREITISKPKQDVFNYIKYLKNQDNFSTWANLDPAMKKEYKGTDATVGFVSSWESNHKKVGTGEQTILGIKEGERIDYELHFIKPWENRAAAYMTTDSLTDNKTKVTWGFKSPMKYSMKVMHTLMNMDKMVGTDFQTGLNNLKGILEK